MSLSPLDRQYLSEANEARDQDMYKHTPFKWSGLSPRGQAVQDLLDDGWEAHDFIEPAPEEEDQ